VAEKSDASCSAIRDAVDIHGLNIVLVQRAPGERAKLTQLIHHDQRAGTNATLQKDSVALLLTESLSTEEQVVDPRGNDQRNRDRYHHLNEREATTALHQQRTLVSRLADRMPPTVRYVTVTRTGRISPAEATCQRSVTPAEMTGPPVANLGSMQRGEVALAAERRASMRLAAVWAARVSIFPRPIIRVMEADALASPMTPTPSTTMAMSASISVKPDRDCLMALPSAVQKVAPPRRNGVPERRDLDQFICAGDGASPS
jgi:hypothetical protein